MNKDEQINLTPKMNKLNFTLIVLVMCFPILDIPQKALDH
jgi:hypothetical protein